MTKIESNDTNGIISTLTNTIDSSGFDESKLLCFLIYNESTPYVRKILKDEELKDAINSISGKRLLILFFKDKPKHSREMSRGILLTIEPSTNGNLEHNYSTFMTNLFGKKIKIDYPSLLIFQAQSNKISDYFLVPISEKNGKDAVYFEIKKLIKVLIKAINKYDSKLLKRKSSLIKIAKSETKKMRFKIYVLKGVKSGYKLISIIKNFLWL